MLPEWHVNEYRSKENQLVTGSGSVPPSDEKIKSSYDRFLDTSISEITKLAVWYGWEFSIR